MGIHPSALGGSQATVELLHLDMGISLKLGVACLTNVQRLATKIIKKQRGRQT